MGFIQKVLGKGPDLITAFGDAVDKVTTTDEERAIAANIRAEMQTEINKVEAQHTSLFIAGWRPAIGWVCVSGLALTFW